MRSAQEFWGLKHLSKRQHLQVHIGTRLLCFILSFLQELVPLGLCGFLEHPAYPVPVLNLLALKCCQMVTFDQCVLGAAGILLLRLSSVHEMIQRRGNNGFCNHGCKAHVRLQGQDKNGNFRTSAAKVYPPQLNATIAAGVCQFAKELMQNSVTEYSINGIPECFRGFRTEEFVGPDCVQKDFHG